MTKTADELAGEAFDAAVGQKFGAQRQGFLNLYGKPGYFSDETQDTLAAKIELIRQRMAAGRSFSEICDDPDVYLGSMDRDYVHYVMLDCPDIGATPVSLDQYRRSQLYRVASDFIRCGF